MKAYKVYAISDGTVIDHIPATRALKVIDILGIENEGILTIGIGFSSKKMGKKDIIKMENKYLGKEETDRISLIAPFTITEIVIVEICYPELTTADLPSARSSVCQSRFLYS